MYVMATASEEVAELVCQEDREESGCEGQAGKKAGRIFVKEGEGAGEFIDRSRLVIGVGHSELRAGDETSAESQEKKSDGQNQRL